MKRITVAKFVMSSFLSVACSFGLTFYVGKVCDVVDSVSWMEYTAKIIDNLGDEKCMYEVDSK